ncbi:MAG: redox-sensing transcriptional repressor [Bacteroidales bacterium]|jgi:redox-sensing transcriptional repressor|nr:redox-sensing transcriptional repressor [Bacteroidales bacterium]MDN5328329.1 redox-sensing transcriptional repressor [Bacteroidales bacterium]
MLSNEIKINKNLSQATLKRLYRYALIAEKGLKKGEVLTSFEKLANLTGEELQTVISDINEAGIKISYGNIIQYEHLEQALKNYLSADNQERVIVAGSTERINRLLQNYEFSGYSFNIIGLLITSGTPADINIPGLRILNKSDAEALISHENITNAVLCTDFSHSKSTAEWLIRNGIKKIWNLSPVSLTTHPDITVENVIPGYPKWKRSYSLS